MKIAVEGCAHGELEKIYDCVETIQAREGFQIDLLICCGDFQSVRNRSDLCSMAVPKKYQEMCTFYKYYSGEKKAPVLTIFIGGNHEASNYLQELPYGGWVAPKIYYLGKAGVIQFGNLRIGGLSGIYKGHDYLQGVWECIPYTQRSIRSVYHIRSLDVFRLSQLKDKVHIMLSHDWPQGITDYGDKEQLLRHKPFFREDVENNRLGSPPALTLLQKMEPDYWFSAHLHCQFVAIYEHEGGKDTRFLALDKCLPKRRHLQIVDVPSEYDGDKCLKYDTEWLAVLKSTNHLLSVKQMDCHLPGPGGDERYDFRPTEAEKNEILDIMNNMTIKEESFVRTACIHNQNDHIIEPKEPLLNPQTANLCEKLGIDDPVQVILARSGRTMLKPEEVNLSTVESPVSQLPPIIATPPNPPHTPKCSKLSLPEPVTPNVEEIKLVTNNIPTVDGLSISDILDVTEECSTPATKKSFKRRNMSMYEREEDEESPCKLSCLDSPNS